MKATKFVSVARNMRGFFYQQDWDSVPEFWKAMQYQRCNENDEVDWARCFNQQGAEVAEYRRGYDIPADC